jgi:hypothetical protein
VVAHDVGRAAGRTGRIVGILAGLGGVLGLGDETVHLPAIDVRRRVGGTVRAAVVEIGGVVIGPVAAAGRRVGYADGGDAVAHRNAVGSGKGTEVAVERAVLLHDHDDVLDLVDALGHAACRRTAAGGRAGASAGRQGEKSRAGQDTERDDPGPGLANYHASSQDHNAVRPDSGR